MVQPDNDGRAAVYQPNWAGDDATSPLLIGRIAGRPFAVPALPVERIVPMAALAPLPGAPPGVIGVLDYRGALMPVVDPHHHLGLPSPPPELSQRLLVVSTATRYLMRLDHVERIISVGPSDIDAIRLPAPHAGAGALVSAVARLDGEAIPILSLDALDPGHIVQQAAGATR